MDDDRGTFTQAVHSEADPRHHARELVTHHRLPDAGRARRAVVRDVLVQVGAADAAVGDGDEDLALARLGLGRLVYLETARPAKRNDFHPLPPVTNSGTGWLSISSAEANMPRLSAAIVARCFFASPP